MSGERENEGRRRHLYQHPQADFHKSSAVVGGIDLGGGGIHCNGEKCVSRTYREIQYQTLSSIPNKKHALKRPNENEIANKLKEGKESNAGIKEKFELKFGWCFTLRSDSSTAVSPCYVIRHQLSVQEWDNNSMSVSHVQLSICQRLLFD